MQRHEDRTGVDAVRAQPGRELVTVDAGAVDPQRGHPPGAGDPGLLLLDAQSRYVAQTLAVCGCNRPLARQELVEPLELSHAESRLQIRDPVVEADLVVPVAPLRVHGVVAKESRKI